MATSNTNTYTSPGIVAPPENDAGCGKTLYVSRLSGGITVALNLLPSFSGSLSMTANGTLNNAMCKQPPSDEYRKRLFVGLQMY